jgi:putative flippase GtrA
MTSRAVVLRSEVRSLLRFGVVGAAGFIADGGVLAALVHLGFGPLNARLVSAPLAVLLTFMLNRHWAFEKADKPFLASFAGYCGIQAVGFLSNLAIYAAAIKFGPYPFNLPLSAFAAASACALVINYAGARLLVFGGPREAAGPRGRSS